MQAEPIGTILEREGLLRCHACQAGIPVMEATSVAEGIACPSCVAKRLRGRDVVITGWLDSFAGRAEAYEAVRSLGGNPATRIDRRTGALICGAEPGSRVLLAHRMGVPVIDEAAFLAALRAN